MKNTFLLLAFSFALSGECLAQTNPPADDWKPSPSNMPGQDYPQVNSEGRVRARLRAPDAKNVQLNLGKKFPMTMDTNGVWMGDSTPQDPGNHYYSLVVDGAEVPDPNGSFIYGSGAWRSNIEIPAPDQDFYALKNVPHGHVREIYYFGKTSNAQRRSFVYTPPDYDKDPGKRYPVLYLLHGDSENETGWSHQGCAGWIMDNLVFVSYGSRENGATGKVHVAALKEAGVNIAYYESPNTAHEWQTWRRSLHGFAPLLFKD